MKSIQTIGFLIIVVLVSSPLSASKFSPYVERGRLIEKVIREDVDGKDNLRKHKAAKVVLRHLQEALTNEVLPALEKEKADKVKSSTLVEQKKILRKIKIRSWSLSSHLDSLLKSVLTCLDKLDLSLGTITELRLQVVRCMNSDSNSNSLRNAAYNTLSPLKKKRSADTLHKYLCRLRARFVSLSSLVTLSLQDLEQEIKVCENNEYNRYQKALFTTDLKLTSMTP